MLGAGLDEFVLDESLVDGKDGDRVDLLVRLGQVAPGVAAVELERVGDVPSQVGVLEGGQGELLGCAAVVDDGQRRNTHRRASSDCPGGAGRAAGPVVLLSQDLQAWQTVEHPLPTSGMTALEVTASPDGDYLLSQPAVPAAGRVQVVGYTSADGRSRTPVTSTEE